MAQEVVLRRLYWVGPMTIGAAVAAVFIVQQISLLVLHDLPKFSDSILHSNEPAYATVFFVGCAVLTFPIIADAASKPLRTFRRWRSACCSCRASRISSPPSAVTQA